MATATEIGSLAARIRPSSGGDSADLASSRRLGRALHGAPWARRKPPAVGGGLVVRFLRTTETSGPAVDHVCTSNGPVSPEMLNSSCTLPLNDYSMEEMRVVSNPRRKTKIVCTIGPSTNTREMIWKLAEEGMNVARLNMSHGDHKSHQKIIDLVKEYNAQSKGNVIAIMLDTKGPEVRSGDVPQPILLKEGQEFNFTIKRGVSSEHTVGVNYDGFVNDVEVGDILLADGGMMSLVVRSKTVDTVQCEVIDGGELKSRRHLNVRGKRATLPTITEKDWEDIKFGVENKVDYYAVSFVKDAEVVNELKDYLRSCNADIKVLVKIESADSISNLHSIISASDGWLWSLVMWVHAPLVPTQALRANRSRTGMEAFVICKAISWKDSGTQVATSSSPLI